MAPLYARYVPPKKAVTSPTQTASSPAPAVKTTTIEPSVTAEQSDGRKKRKRDEAEELERRTRKEHKKKEKEHRSGDVDGHIVPDIDDAAAKSRTQAREDANAAGAATSSEVTSPKRQKRKKSREEAGDARQDGPDDGPKVESDTELRRHRSVMKKYHKAAERSTTLQAEAGDDDLAVEEARELHGMC